MFKHQIKDQVPRSRGRWKDDDEDSNMPKQTIPKTMNNKTEPSSNSKQPQHQQSTYQQQTIQPKQQPKKEDSFKLEQRLLDDILQPTGISIRPSDHLLNEFYRRAKNLDRDKIFNGIMDKLVNYQSYITQQESVKTLTKCLYLVDHLVQNKLEDIYEAFEERRNLFSNIKESYPTNKKINEICDNIINAYGDETQVKGNDNQPQTNSMQHKDNNNGVLLDIDFPEQESNNTNLLNQNEHRPIDKTNHLLEDLFDVNPNNNNHNNNQPLMNNEVKTDEKKNQAKGFSFIKAKPQPGEEKKVQNEQGKSELDNLFSNSSSINKGIPIVNLSNNIPPSSLFIPLDAPIDLTKMTFNNTKPQGPQFNYDLVYENTNVLKEKNDNDPFNFVNDMIKSKK